MWDTIVAALGAKKILSQQGHNNSKTQKSPDFQKLVQSYDQVCL